MSSTKEEELIKEWAVSKSSRICVDRESLWDTYNTAGDVIEYDFQTVPELKKMFRENLMGCEEVILPLTVAAFKKKVQERMRGKQDFKDKSDKDDFAISEFIYIF